MKLFIAGFGVVAQAVVEQLAARRDAFYADAGLTPRIVGVSDSRGVAVDPRGLDGAELLQIKRDEGTIAAYPDHGRDTMDIRDLLAHVDADVLIEATPSSLADPSAAINHLKIAFAHGMHAISVNKAPLAVAMPALLELAAFNGVEFRFSGTVGAGTPVLSLAEQCALGDEIIRARGILNGTTNFILWRMHEQNATFAAALAEAQELGYAETDPSADIDGIDTATKVVIFANRILGRPATIDDVELTGIRDIPAEKIADAAARGKRLKLLGEIAGADEPLRVAPLEIEAGCPLDVPASLNALTLTLRHGGDVTLVGRGAGGPETATAVVRDLLDIWRRIADQG